MSATLRLAAVGAIVTTVALAGCVGRYKSDFSVVVVNRTVNALQVLANGSAVGQVNANQSGTFTLTLEEANANTLTNGVAPSPVAQAVITAKDLKTNVLSTAKTTDLTQGTPSYVTFTASDFPTSTPTVARFSFSPTSPGPNQDVQFNASASTPSTATFAWNFGDGENGTGVSPTHRFARVGAFTVALTVTSDTGQVATSTNTVQVTTTLAGQQVNFTFSPAAPGVNQDVFFNASTSTVNGGTYAWDFGDGGTATGVTATHRFVRAGTYAVTVRATNTGNQTAAASRNVTVSSTSPSVQASFVFSPTAPATNQDIVFNASASAPANSTFAWVFGDGGTASGVTPSHRFTSPGTYTVTLTVTNDIGQSATTSRTVTVAAASPQVLASFVFSPTAPGVNQSVFFDASASRPSTGTFSWAFGDGTTATGDTTTHQFAQAATYTVLLVVTNEFGQTATASRNVTVTNTSAQVTASFTFSPVTPGINQDVFFNASASTPTTGTFSWNFGDGTTGSGITPTHQFSAPATYTVNLVVSNGAGQQSATSKTVTVAATGALSADFTFSPTDPDISIGTNSVIFDATPSSSGVTAWTWDFGDGTTTTGQRVTHTFALPGTWVVRLTVGSGSQTGTITKNVTVTP